MRDTVTVQFQLPEFGTEDLQRYIGNIGRHDDGNVCKQGRLKLPWSMLTLDEENQLH